MMQHTVDVFGLQQTHPWVPCSLPQCCTHLRDSTCKAMLAEAHRPS